MAAAGEPESLRGKRVVAAIDFRHTIFYATDADSGERPTSVVADDPKGYYHKVSHRAGNPRGTYEPDSQEYWREISDALAPAAAILLLGHGQGRANAYPSFCRVRRGASPRDRREDRGRCPRRP